MICWYLGGGKAEFLCPVCSRVRVSPARFDLERLSHADLLCPGCGAVVPCRVIPPSEFMSLAAEYEFSAEFGDVVGLDPACALAWRRYHRLDMSHPQTGTDALAVMCGQHVMRDVLGRCALSIDPVRDGHVLDWTIGCVHVLLDDDGFFRLSADDACDFPGVVWSATPHVSQRFHWTSRLFSGHVLPGVVLLLKQAITT